MLILHAISIMNLDRLINFEFKNSKTSFTNKSSTVTQMWQRKCHAYDLGFEDKLELFPSYLS